MKKDKRVSIDKMCYLCEHSCDIACSDDVLCERYGVVSGSYTCKYFSVDLIRIKPKRQKQPEKLDFVDIDGK